jgi:hypothetical protein
MGKIKHGHTYIERTGIADGEHQFHAKKKKQVHVNGKNTLIQRK